ncbi:MAG TPA: ribonuclease R [Verrucomicrobiae bacterium]|nr:ribonuclease R [Verrucomicrobiae bacterium]
MEEQILGLLGRKDYSPATETELLGALNLPPDRQSQLNRILRQLERSGEITRTKGGRYIKSREADLIPGRIQINRAGKGFLQPDDAGLKEITIPENATGTALHGDRVLVRRDARPRGLRPGRGAAQETGSVIRILERKRTQLVGTLQRGRQFLYVIPDDPRMPHDIYVPEPRDVGRKPHIGDKVVVELLEWTSRHNNPEGEIIEVLGAPDAEGVDMLSVLRQYNLPLHFPKAVLAEVRANGTTVLPHELAGREDCREHHVITIDPDDAKDFDDAICLKRISHDQWRLWVHIADVSHYVKPGSALDTEARKRGNSTYLVDRVIPMLPEALSNELCSLKPNVDRLTKCVEFLISNEGRVLSAKFYPAVIHSQRRFTYQEVFAILQRQPHPGDSIERMLHDAHELAQKIRRLRFKAGSLALDFPETKVRLDEHGRVSRIEKVENDVSHQLIEEYMLLANEAVATRLMSQNQKAIYRVHEEPDEQRLNEFREDVLSHHIPCGNLTKRPEVAKLLQKLDTIPIGAALKIGFLRSLMRARYAIEPLGHYGLAKPKYTHFTSPIRRYADLVVHRALFNSSHGSTHSLKETADHISDTERNSADAERDSKDVKMYAFLKAQLEMDQPPAYSALVTDVRNFGFFVDVPGLAMSGLVHLSSIADDFFEFDESRGQLTGRRTRRSIRLGDKVEVQIAKVDSFKKQVDFRLAHERKDRDRPPVAAGEPRGRRPHSPKPHGWRRAADGDRPRSERQQQRPSQRFQDRQQSRDQSRPPQQKSGKFKSQSHSRPPSGGGNFPAGSSRPQIPSSHSRSKFGRRRRR